MVLAIVLELLRVEDFLEVVLIIFVLQKLGESLCEPKVMKIFDLVLAKQLHVCTFWRNYVFLAVESSYSVAPLVNQLFPVDLVHKQIKSTTRTCI